MDVSRLDKGCHRRSEWGKMNSKGASLLSKKYKERIISHETHVTMRTKKQKKTSLIWSKKVHLKVKIYFKILLRTFQAEKGTWKAQRDPSLIKCSAWKNISIYYMAKEPVFYEASWGKNTLKTERPHIALWVSTWI